MYQTEYTENYARNENEVYPQSTAIIHDPRGWFSVVATNEFGEIVYDKGLLTRKMARDEYARMVE
jgi:hypothetical protein